MIPFHLFFLQTGRRETPVMGLHSFCEPCCCIYPPRVRALVTRALRPPEVQRMEEVGLGKQSWESIVPPTDRGFRALLLFLWRQGWRRSGLSVRGCFGGRKAKQRSGPAERKAVLSWCGYALQVLQPKEDLTM